MDGQVVGLVALDDVLRFFFRSMPFVTLEDDLRGYFFLNRSSNTACFRVPFDMIPTFESGRHWFSPAKTERSRLNEIAGRGQFSSELFYSDQKSMNTPRANTRTETSRRYVLSCKSRIIRWPINVPKMQPIEAVRSKGH